MFCNSFTAGNIFLVVYTKYGINHIGLQHRLRYLTANKTKGKTDVTFHSFYVISALLG
jgi:hypothetical protein